MLLARGNIERPRQIAKKESAAVAFVFATRCVIKARVVIEALDQLGRRSSGSLVPPCDHLADVQILGAHEQFHILQLTMNVSFPTPITFLRQIRDSLQTN